MQAGGWGGGLLLGESHCSITSERLFSVFECGIEVEIPHPRDLWLGWSWPLPRGLPPFVWRRHSGRMDWQEKGWWFFTVRPESGSGDRCKLRQTVPLLANLPGWLKTRRLLSLICLEEALNRIPETCILKLIKVLHLRMTKACHLLEVRPHEIPCNLAHQSLFQTLILR